MRLYSPNIHRCQHIKVNGTQCGSPAVRHYRHCYFHGRWHEQHITFATTAKTVPAIDLPVLEDANSIQVAIMQVIGLLLTGHIEHKAAGLILYGLQTASCNLRHTKFEAEPQSIVVDPARVGETRMDSLLWDNSHFDGTEEDEEDTEDDNSSSEMIVGSATRPELSAETNSEEESEPLADNWRDEVRTQITTMVKQHASSLLAAAASGKQAPRRVQLE